MKKTIITLIMSCAVSVSYAQLKVFQNGNVLLNSDCDTAKSALSIACEGEKNYTIRSRTDMNGINCVVDGNSLNWGFGGDFLTFCDNTNFSVGVKGEIRSQGFLERTCGRAFGVIGSAGFATSGWNYGVFGRLDGTTSGAAVYGTTDKTENGIGLKKRYAGYFNGEVGISGNLKVNGSIDGVLIGMAVEQEGETRMNARAGNETAMETETVHDKLTGISAVAYRHKLPAKAPAMAGDTTQTIRGIGAIEAQNLSKTHYALSAEQLEAVYPDLVYTKEDGTKAINYMELIPLLVQSIGELSAKIEQLENPSGRQATPKQQAATACISNSSISEASLSQNKPNPFVTSTDIKVNIPTSANTAMLNIYDLSGKQIKGIQVNERGEHSIYVTSEGLAPGMYIYSLIIDGKLIDTKRMVVTQ